MAEQAGLLAADLVEAGLLVALDDGGRVRIGQSVANQKDASAAAR